MRLPFLMCTATLALVLSACGGGSTTGSGGSGGSGNAGGSAGMGGSAGSAGSAGMGGNAGSAGMGGSGGAMGCVVDGVVSGTEQCDDGNKDEGDGCDNDCTFSCADAAKDCAAPPECNTAACSAAHTCVAAPDPTLNGMACGADGTCKDGACQAKTCGNGAEDPGEQCDFGAGNGPGAGCEADCTFSCDTAMDLCDDGDVCNGPEVCTAVSVQGKVGQRCVTGAPPANCALCNGGVCMNATCVVSKCNDGCLDPAAGEECEPPGSATCNAMCKKTVPIGCGDGKRDAGEQCDDGNNVNIDGCDYTCKLEQSQRTNFIEMQFAADAFCGGANALGGAIASVAQSQFQMALSSAVTAGTAGSLFKVMGLDDLTGKDDPAAALGVVGATKFNGAGYNGNNDVDWWYTVDPVWLDANRNPIHTLPAAFTAGVLNAGPGNVLMPNFLTGSPPIVSLSGVKIQLQVGASTAPLTSTGMPPGHLAAEHLDPALTSFQTASLPNSMGAGKMCADLSADSLAQGTIPTQFLPPSQTKCNEGYTAQNSLLDLLVGGCKVIVIQAINATQPDKVDPLAMQPGAGGPYTFTTDAMKKVNGCKDKNGADVDLAMCLKAASYSSYFKISTDRVILK